jgi:hypothetical protein
MAGERKRSDEYNRGYEDGLVGAGPDRSQATLELMQDYMDGYRRGRREKGGKR